MLDVEYVTPFSSFLVLVKDIQGCDYGMFDDMNEDIIVSHVGVISFHMVSVFGVLMLTGEEQTLRIFDTNAITCELSASAIVFDSFPSRWIPKRTQMGAGVR